MSKENISRAFKIALQREAKEVEYRLYMNYSFFDLLKLLNTSEEKVKLLKSRAGEMLSTNISYSDEDIKDFFSRNDLKIAVCISGHVRNYKENLKSINKFLIQPLNADVFLHTWDKVGAQKILTEGNIGPSPDQSLPLGDDFLNYIDNLKSLKIEKNESFLEQIEKELGDKLFYMYGQRISQTTFGGCAEPKFIYSQYYSVFQSYLLLEEYSNKHNIQYDAIIKIRADYKLSSGIFKEDFDLINTSRDIIFIPDLPYSNHGHPVCCMCISDLEHNFDGHVEDVCDVFAYSNKENMKKYMSVYNNFEEIRNIFNNLNTQYVNNKEYLLENFKHFKVANIWDKKNYNINCFYPERIFRHYLKEYKLKPSKLSGRVLR
jgi:hypothetical protein